MHKFADCDIFARFLGISVGCQKLQATHSQEITIRPNAPEPPSELVAVEFDESLFADCYKINDDNEVDL